MSKKTYLITGGAGFIGAALVRRLVHHGHRVRVFDNLSRGSAQRLIDIQNDFEWIKADIRNPDAVNCATRGVDSVCHLAFVNGTQYFYEKPDLVLDVGVKGMSNVLDACLKHDVRELALASSSEVYQTPPNIPTDETAPLSIPDPLNPRYTYAAGKLINEMMALHTSIFERVIIFRPHNVYGPDMGTEHVIPQLILRALSLLAKHPNGSISFPIQGNGTETRAFVHINDFINAVMILLDKGEHRNIYHIGTEEETAICDLVTLLFNHFGRPFTLIPGERPPGGTRRRCPLISKLRALGIIHK